MYMRCVSICEYACEPVYACTCECVQVCVHECVHMYLLVCVSVSCECTRVYACVGESSSV